MAQLAHMTIPDSQYLKASSVVQIYKPLYVLNYHGTNKSVWHVKSVYFCKGCVSPWNPEAFSLANERKVKKWNVREPLVTNVRSFEPANPIRSRYWGFWVRFWLGNSKNSFWLDRTWRVCPEVLSSPASSPHTSSWARKPSGYQGRVVYNCKIPGQSKVDLSSHLLSYQELLTFGEIFGGSFSLVQQDLNGVKNKLSFEDIIWLFWWLGQCYVCSQLPLGGHARDQLRLSALERCPPWREMK